MHILLDEYRVLVTDIFKMFSTSNPVGATELMAKLIEKDRELTETVRECKWLL